MKFLDKIKVINSVIQCKGHILFIGLPEKLTTKECADLCKKVCNWIKKK